MRNIIAVLLAIVFCIALISYAAYSKEQVADHVTAVAEDMGCKLIEQSYYHPENFYVDCGDDGVQIITLGKE